MAVRTKEEVVEYSRAHGLRRALVITALALEMRAVRAHLKPLGSVLGRSGTIYECGQFSGDGSEWLVVVVESGAGTHPAHAVVTSAQIDFSGFEIMVFVGIAASRKAEAPIGSVVASSILYSPLTGKFDAERGHTGRPRPVYPDRDLVGVAQKVERDGEWAARIRNPLRETLLDVSDARYPKPFPPQAFIAPIASLEAVSADPKSEPEAHISQNYSDTLAIEMEGYGAAYAANLEQTPLIVIRGISDMRSGKIAELDAIHQPVAAAHASAFTFEVISVWAQFRRIDAATSIASTPSPPQLPSSAPPSPAKPKPPVSNAAVSAQNILVLNFAGAKADFPPAKVDQILETLRQIAGNPALKVISTEEGSFRMLISGSAEDRNKIDKPETYETLLRERSVRLIGVVSGEQYAAAKSVEELLNRASRDLLDWPQELPDGTRLPRPELQRLLSLVEEANSSTTALTGPPGSGKSALLASLGQALMKSGIPVLAIKADLLDPEIKTEEDLQRQLALPQSPRSILIQLSHLRPVVLLIDQVDALAGYVDLRTGRLSVLLNLVRALGERRNIHIVLSSRTFEFEHDTRLKAVRAESLELALPPWSVVLPVLESRGIQAAGWPVDAQELMRSPQALTTYLKIVKQGDVNPPFEKYQEMLEQLWRQQILVRPDGARLAKLAGVIAENMAEKETLWLAAARFDDQAADLRSLIGIGILTDYEGAGGRIGFSHQTVFDHALARAFAKGEGKLSSYVLERQSSLFVRPKLWAALTYLREVEPPTYEAELKTMWSTQQLRLHLRLMLIEFMGQQRSPTPFEAKLFEQALTSDQRPTALMAIAGSPGWLKLLGATHIARAMAAKDEAGRAFAILNSAWAFGFDAVIALVKKHWLPIGEFDDYILGLLQHCPKWNEEVTKLASKVLERSTVTPHSFDYLISTVGAEYPTAALTLVATRLNAQLRDAKTAASSRKAPRPSEEATSVEHMAWSMNHSPEQPLTNLLEQRDGWEGLEALAKGHPALFLQHLWPWYSDALATLLSFRDHESERPGFPLPWGLDLRFPEEDESGLDEFPVLGALTAALEAFAAEDEEAFLGWLANHENEQAMPTQRLFANALASQPERYAERAAQFLLTDKNRLHLGSIHDSSATSKRLVRAVSPHWSPAPLNSFVNEVLAYKPEIPSHIKGKERKHFNDFLRLAKLGILSSVPIERLSDTARRVVAEERRRFPKDRGGSGIQGGWIGSPISAEGLSKASEADVVNAFREVPDAAGWDHPKQWMKGGNIQLSRAFAETAKKDPERAARILDQLEPSFGTRAAGYALDSMAENASPELVISLVHKLNQRGFRGGEFRRSAASAVQRLMQREVSIDDGILNLLKTWLNDKETSEPDKGEKADDDDQLAEIEPRDEEEKKKEEKPRGSILWDAGGFSVLPQGNFPILDVVSQILLHRQGSDDLLAVYRGHLDTDEDSNVWRALLRFVRYIHPAKVEDLADFVKRLLEKYPEIATTRDAITMFAYLHWRLPSLVASQVKKWKTSTSRLQQGYGEIVALVALTQPSLDWPQALLKEIVSTTSMTDARLGAVYAAVNIWPEAEHKEPVSNLLVVLIPDADKAIWSAIFDLFRVVDEITPEPEWILLLQSLSEHMDKISGVNSSFVVERLQTLLPHQALLVAKISKGLVDGWREELGDIRTATASSARELVDLAITLHRLGPETRDLGTGLFEDLLLINAYTARETLDEIDNRFRTTPRTPRRRLPRRTRRAKRGNVA